MKPLGINGATKDARNAVGDIVADIRICTSGWTGFSCCVWMSRQMHNSRGSDSGCIHCTCAAVSSSKAIRVQCRVHNTAQ